MDRRLALTAVALVALLAVGAFAVATWMKPEQGGSGAFPVLIVGPDGELFNGTVDADNATAMSLLQAAAEEANLAVHVEDSSFGPYVAGIGPYEGSGSGGWVYEVLQDGTWTSGDRRADEFAIQPGETLRWKWTAWG